MGLYAWIARHEAVAREAGVTDKEIAALKEMAYKTEQALVKLRSELELADLEVRKVLDSAQPSREALNKAIEAAGRAQTEIRKLVLGSRLEMRELLGVEKVQRIRQKMRAQREERCRLARCRRGKAGPLGRGRCSAPAPHEEVEAED